MTKVSLRKWLEQNADVKVADFAASLIPNLSRKMYGIRLPILRKKAKEISAEFDDISNDSCEELLLKAYIIGGLKNIDYQMQKVKQFVELIDNWMICDSFCSALTSAKKYQDVFWPMVCCYAKSSKDYEQRFAYVMMLKYFCNDDYIDEVLAYLAEAQPKIWDTKQGVAWALAECFIKFQDKTERALPKFAPELIKLTRRKILDSKRVSIDIKQRIKNGNLVHPV